jgi:hypothetical protein
MRGGTLIFDILFPGHFEYVPVPHLVSRSLSIGVESFYPAQNVCTGRPTTNEEDNDFLDQSSVERSTEYVRHSCEHVLMQGGKYHGRRQGRSGYANDPPFGKNLLN